MVQLPALNTPQFDWVKSRLRGRGQPVPPIFQPEVAAEEIVRASDEGRREVFVGWPTVVAILGDKIAPAAGDWYLARTGFDSQQTSEPEDPQRPHNLWAPVDEDRDFGAHGRFDARARSSSSQVWMSRHRGPLAAAGLIAAAIALLTTQGRRGTYALE
jgi:hypothetical protein